LPNTKSDLPFLPFSRPTLSEAAIQEVVDCLKSGWITTGPRTEKFEKMLSDYLNNPNVFALTSGTAALHLCLLGLNLKSTDEVIAPAMTFVSTFNTIVIAGGKPVLVDIDPSTYNIDVSKLEQAITKNTKAIMPVHLTGLAADLDPIYNLAKKYNLRVIEDAAQAIGTKYKNKLIGSFGDTQIFSFHPNKNITTGEGGCVATSDPELAKFIKVMRFHGIDRDAFNRFSKEGSQHYDVIAPGFKYNMLDMQAAIGIHQLPELDHFNKARKKLAQRYYDLLHDWPEWTLPPNPATSDGHSWHLYAPLINPEKAKMSRDEFMDVMKHEYNIGIGLHYDAPYLYTYYMKNHGFTSNQFPHAKNIGERIMSLPLFPLMTEDEQDRVIDAMKKIFGRT
jgi:dTDP-4-amino-4,6-dideoxygalactose transaminase